MKKFAKRAAAILLAVVLTFSLAGCYNENLTWSAKLGDNELPIGAYIYYLSAAYNEAASQTDSEMKVLDGEIEGTDAEAWIRSRAQEYVDQYYWVDSEMERLGLEMTSEDYANAQANTTSYWTYFGSSFEDYGIAQSSFDLAYSQYSVKYLKIFEALYGIGGEREIPEEDLIQYYLDTYYSYEYFTVSLTSTDEEGNTVDLTDEEKAELLEKLEATKKEIESGDLTVTEAANEYAKERTEDATYQVAVDSVESMKSYYLPDEFIETITTMKTDDVAVVETSGTLVLVKLLPIEETADETMDNENSRLSFMLALKTDDFSEYVKTCAAAMEGIEMNEKAISRYKPSMFAETSEYGTSVAAEESEAE